MSDSLCFFTCYCALLLLVCVMCGSTAGAGGGIYVSADPARGLDNSSCWDGGEQWPCTTVALALQGVLNTSNATWHPGIFIEAGSHKLDEAVVLSGEERPHLENITIVGLPCQQRRAPVYGNGLPKPDVTIHCINNSQSGLTFLSVKGGITLENIYLYGCGILQISTSTYKGAFLKFYTALYFLFCENLHFQNVWVTHSISTGIVVYASRGVNTFINCSFSHNQHSNTSLHGGGGGFFLEFPYCKPNAPLSDCDNQTNIPEIYTDGATYRFEDCVFAHNLAKVHCCKETIFPVQVGQDHMALGRGGGLSIYLKGNVTSCKVTILDCKFIDNTALWGGGLFVEYQDNAQNNRLSVNSSYFELNKSPSKILKNEGTGGGGVRASYILIGHSYPKINSIVFNHCCFKNNTAYYGGGVSFLGGREHSVFIATNTIQFLLCEWMGNAARLGAAIDLSWKTTATSGAVMQVNFTDTTIWHHGNKSNLQTVGSPTGLGAMYIDSLPVVFGGYVLFDHNNHTALAASNAQIEFYPGCNATFTNNVGEVGGAMFLIGSTFLRAFNNTEFHYKNNMAYIFGGAIYFFNPNERYMFSSGNCFIRYMEDDIDPRQWFVSFVFKNNSHTARNHSRPNSIYTTSLIPCVWGGDLGPYDPSSINDTFCWKSNTSIWKYENDCVNEIATTPAAFADNNYAAHFYPGERKHLDIKTKDDLGTESDVTGIFVLTATSSNQSIASVDPSSKYVSDDTLKINGRSGKSIWISLCTQAPRVVCTRINITLDTCPPGFNSTIDTCICEGGTSHRGMVECSQHNGVFHSRLVREGTWIGKYHSLNMYVAGISPFTFSADSSKSRREYSRSEINLNLTDIEDSQCSNQHRKGILCSRCEDGYGPAMSSWALDCVQCNSTTRQHSAVRFVCLQLVLLIIVFLILLSFNIRLTSGPTNAFIFYSQTIVAIFYDRMQKYRTFTKAWVVVYSIWNLRLLEVFPNYCTSGIDSFATVIALEYISAIFPLILIALFYLFASLYNRGIQPILCLCRPVHHCVARFRVNTLQRTITDALAAFLLLSYTKFTIVSLRLLSPSHLYDYHGNLTVTVMFFDGKIGFFHLEHAPYVVAAVFCLLFVVALPPLLLLLYPLKSIHKALSLLHCERYLPGGRLELFLNAFYGCYKDGTTADSRDYRYFAGLYFIFRIVFAVVYSVETEFNSYFLSHHILCIMGILLFSICRPYRNDFYNNLDASMFALLGLINALSSYDYYSSSPKLLYIENALIWLPMLYITAYSVYYMWTTYNLRKKLCCLCHWKPFKTSTSGDGISDDSLLRLLDTRMAGRSHAIAAVHGLRQNDACNDDLCHSNSSRTHYGSNVGDGSHPIDSHFMHLEL